MDIKKIIQQEVRRVLSERLAFASTEGEIPMIIQGPKGHFLGMASKGAGGEMVTRSVESPMFKTPQEVCKFYSNWDPSRATMEEGSIVEDGGQNYRILGDPSKVCGINEQDDFDYAGEEREYHDRIESEKEMNAIVGSDILNYFPFSELPETRKEATSDFYRNGVPNWGKVQIPSLNQADAQTTILSKADLTGMEWPAMKRTTPLKDLPAQSDPGYLADFKSTYGEEPLFVLNPDEVWYNKVEIVNPKFVEKRKKGVETKASALKDFGTTAEGIADKLVDTSTMDTPTGTLFVMDLGESVYKKIKNIIHEHKKDNKRRD